ncbi:MAG: hypothetical protein IPN53_05300 [Comamonadaceae bacterium]|nr:hypothetical protein [Comamonadaceae bacterium]
MSWADHGLEHFNNLFLKITLIMTNLFPTADCDAGAIASLAKYVPSLAGSSPPTQRLGFHLIDGILVPYSFVRKVEHELSNDRLNCFKVTNVLDLFSHTFLESLTPLEMKVLGGCVLLLIEKGFVPFSLVDEKEAA